MLISVVGYLYKIISKILENMIRLAINEVMSETKTRFIQERFIVDGILTTNESVMRLKKRRNMVYCSRCIFRKFMTP